MSFLAAAGDAGAPRAVERWPYRFFVYSAAATLALGVEITYTRIIGSMGDFLGCKMMQSIFERIAHKGRLTNNR